MPTGRWWRCQAAKCSASRWRAALSTGRSCCCCRRSIRVTRCASRCGRKISVSGGKRAATYFPRACSIAAIRARRRSTTSICSAGGWRSSNSAPRPAIRSGSRPLFLCHAKVAGRIVIWGRRLTNKHLPVRWLHPSRRAQGRAPQDEVLDPHGEERGNAARLEPRGQGCLELISAKPAVDPNDRTGNVARLRRDEEDGKRCEIFGPAPITHRNLFFGKELPLIFR